MPTGQQGGAQTLTPPKTRLTAAWHNAWQQYRGDAPRKLIKTQSVYIPAIRRLGYSHRVKG